MGPAPHSAPNQHGAPDRHGAPNWLSADEQRVWRLYRQVTQDVDARLERQLERDAGMPHAHYAILAVLSESDDGERRLSDLANALGYSKSRLSHAVTSLARKGWVERRRCDDDGRGQLARITSEGRSALGAAAPGHVDEVRAAIFDRLDADELDQLERLLVRLNDSDHGLREPGMSARGAVKRPNEKNNGTNS